MLNPKSDMTANWCPKLSELQAIMQQTKPWAVQMDRYKRGIDNKSIDVHLSPRFITRLQSIAHGMVQHDVSTNYWNKPSKPVANVDLENFRNAYDGLMDLSMQPQGDLSAVEWVRLVQLAVFKCVLLTVFNEIQELRLRLEASRDETASGNRLQYHQRLAVLARENGTVFYRVSRRIFGMVERLEATRLRRIRKAKLGMSWPIPQEALFNVLLQLPALLNEEMAMYHYPMLCLGEHGRVHRSNLNKCIVEVFKDYLPNWIQPQATVADGPISELSEPRELPALRVINRLDHGNLRGFMETEIVLSQFLNEVEYKQLRYTWLDEPSNLVRLLSLSAMQSAEKNPLAPVFTDEDVANRWRSFMREMREDLFQRIDNMDVTQYAAASYWTAQVCQGLPPNTTASPRLVYEYLTGQQERQKVLKRLANNNTSEQDIAVSAKVLDGALAEIRQLSRDGRRKYLGRILIDFLTLRRDLKLAYKTFEAMDHICIFKDERNLALSRANNLLHEFLLSDEIQEEQRIICHAILKADLRGSSKITTELRAKKLNPATHFSENFFNPITDCLEDFGANKVFVEGDAVILSILEKTGDKYNQTVACACGLGAEILNVVERQNVINRRYGLPDLELGLGIAFVNEEPTFLYDGNRPIMISSAINLADRLSSCAKGLRDAAFAKANRPFRVEVLLPPEGSDATAGAKTDVLRYNVNGIEMDQAAFNKLKTELILRPLYVKIGGQMETLHVGRYPDRADRMHWLVVRESPLHVWEFGEISKYPAPGNRFFYEVVMDQDLIDKIRNKLGSGRGERDSTDSSTFPGTT